ncbi:hypothetical protein OCU04_004584 [Sclerotinia nivalis]|uniref:Nephrocystin 3-like N-terminal domain-containing protein n=1 Tax=Sclerotinia nivalis TaxID=352851 RepID=A0A9X0AQQ7_9HELO|nr:hypothetical protein OCU04_004584 [Sclerotinia nivalis]
MPEPDFSVHGSGENEAEKGVAALQKKFGLMVNEASSSTPAEYDIVAVHGLGGDSKHTWGKPLGDGTWFKEALFPNTNVRIMTYNYDLEATPGTIYTRKGILDEASKLLKNLLNLREPVASENVVIDAESDNGLESRDKRRPLIFLGHDLGFIIIKQALLLAGCDLSNDESIRTSTVAMVSFGTPHRHRTFEDMEKSVANLLFTNGRSDLQNFMTAVNRLSPTIVDINSLFIYSKILVQVRMINIFPTWEDHVLQVFDEFMSTMNVPFEKRIGINRPQKELPCSLEDYNSISGSVLDFISYSSDITSPLSRYLKIMLSQASPIYPLEVTDGILSSEADLAWIGEDAPTETSVLYFEFKKHDSRFNNLKSMFYTFLAQMISHCRGIYFFNASVEKFIEYQSWTSQHLHKLIASLPPSIIKNIRFVINGIDLCEEDCEWFLADLAFISKNSEFPFKVIVPSTGYQQILSECLTIDLYQHQSDTVPRLKSSSATVWYALAQLLQERPQYCNFEAPLREILNQSNKDYVCHLILKWLKFKPHPTTKLSIKGILQSLSPATAEHVVTAIMASIPTGRHPWAQWVIEWVAYPLTIWELRGVDIDINVEISDREEFTTQELMEKLYETFGGIFVVKNNEVSFCHLSLRDVFTTLAPSNSWFYSGNRRNSHKNIAVFCLKYFSLTEIQEQAATFYLVGLEQDPQICPVQFEA